MVDQSLLTFKYEDKRLVSSEDHYLEVNQRIRQKEKGPFIICVDTSESMYGRPEQIAKVLCLGILKMASREKRRAYLINFFDRHKKLWIFTTLPIRLMLWQNSSRCRFMAVPIFPSRCTKPFASSKPMITATLMCWSFLIFIMYRVDKEVLKEVRFYQQNHNVQFHSLTLSNDPSTQILEYFDTTWIYDPQRKGVIRELTKSLVKKHLRKILNWPFIHKSVFGFFIRAANGQNSPPTSLRKYSCSAATLRFSRLVGANFDSFSPAN